MASVRYDIVSIGTLSRNRLWHETQAVRTPHATSTLIRAGRRRILVDPGLPGPAMAARLFERTGLRPEQIDTVFLTSFRPSHRAGAAIFQQASILIHEVEQRLVQQYLEQVLAQASAEDAGRKAIEDDLRLLETLQPAPDQIEETVDLFPLFGYTPGNSGLLLSLSTTTVLIAGDAVATQEHFLAGQVLPDAYDLEAAKESLREVYEIADLIVPGHDNVFQNPRAMGI